VRKKLISLVCRWEFRGLLILDQRSPRIGEENSYFFVFLPYPGGGGGVGGYGSVEPRPHRTTSSVGVRDGDQSKGSKATNPCACKRAVTLMDWNSRALVGVAGERHVQMRKGGHGQREVKGGKEKSKQKCAKRSRSFS